MKESNNVIFEYQIMRSASLLLLFIGALINVESLAQSKFDWYNQTLTIEERARA